MLIPISIEENNIDTSDTEISNSTFKDLKLKEEHIEEFLRKNIEVIFGEEESLLIVGQQVNNKEKGRSDLTAIDENGNIVLIEIKRDADE
jgi:RecB family endonuclease NucS